MPPSAGNESGAVLPKAKKRRSNAVARAAGFRRRRKKGSEALLVLCPFCSHDDTRVVDSRLTRDGLQIRRRRQCESCGSRFNTYEAPELKAPRIIKADGGREVFSEQKLRDGMMRALEKRPVETREIEHAIRSLLREISTVEDSEIPSSLLGEWVMRELAKLDQVAYVRFASVYKRFEDVQAFRDVIERLEREPPADDAERQISLLESAQEQDTPGGK